LFESKNIKKRKKKLLLKERKQKEEQSWNNHKGPCNKAQPRKKKEKLDLSGEKESL